MLTRDFAPRDARAAINLYANDRPYVDPMQWRCVGLSRRRGRGPLYLFRDQTKNVMILTPGGHKVGELQALRQAFGIIDDLMRHQP